MANSIILTLLFLIFLSACGDKKDQYGLTEFERNLIEMKLKHRNQDNAVEFEFAVMDKQTDLIITDMRIGRDTMITQKLRKLELEKFISDYNDPYDIAKDTALTYEKYADYCKAHNYDVKTYVNYINK